MNKIVVIGSLNMDLVTNTADIPAPGETVIGGDLATVPGGKGANQAVAAARAGAQVSMVGHVGNDVFAQRLLDGLDADGIDRANVTRVDTASGVALIVVDAAGQNSIVVAPGANGRVTPADIAAAESTIAAADVMLLQLEIPVESVEAAAALGQAHGVTVILNPAPAQPLSAELLANVDLLIPNESETATLTGRPTGTVEEIRAAAGALRDQGVGTVIVTMGGRGALHADATGLRRYHPFAVETVVDTTAAGDAFVGGLAAALARGDAPADAIVWGSAAGALAVTKAGAQPSLPRRDALEEMVATATPLQREGERL